MRRLGRPAVVLLLAIVAAGLVAVTPAALAQPTPDPDPSGEGSGAGSGSAATPVASPGSRPPLRSELLWRFHLRVLRAAK